MHPIVIGSETSRFAIHGYGLMLALSFMLGIYFAMRRAQKEGVDPNKIMDLSVWIVLAAIIGSRFLYVVYHLEEFHGHWLDTINPFQSNGKIGIAGLTMLGGVVLAIVVGIAFLWIKKMNILKVCDIMIPSVALGIFLTRIGCFLNGCCHGLPSNSIFGVTFTNPYSACAPHLMNIPLHPTQLYSSFYGLVIFGLLLFAEKFKKFDGFLFFLFFVLYGICRFIIDYFRYYEDSAMVGGLGITVNQLISLAMMIIGIVLLIVKFYKIKK